MSVQCETLRGYGHRLTLIHNNRVTSSMIVRGRLTERHIANLHERAKLYALSPVRQLLFSFFGR